MSASDQQPQVVESAWLRVARAVTLVGGGGLLLTGLLSGALYLLAWFLAPPFGREGPNPLYAVAFALLVIAGLFGVALVAQAVFSLRRQPSRLLHLPAPPVVLAALLFAVVLGSLAPLFGPASGLVFPVAYVFGIALPILVLLSLAWRALARRGLAVRWRDTIVQVASGAFLATSTALMIEGAVLGMVVLVGIVAFNATPGGAEALREALRSLQNSSGPGSLQLQGLFSSPAVVVAALFVLSLAVPIIEEMVKAIGVVLFSYRSPTAPVALWWGLLGGAGFALIEGVTNGSMALGQYAWGIVVLLRAGTSLIHCCTSALVGLGWHGWIEHGDFLFWLRRYALAVLLHGVWNGLSLGLALLPSGQSLVSGRGAVGLVATALLALELIAIAVLLYRLVTATYSPDSPLAVSDSVAPS